MRGNQVPVVGTWYMKANGELVLVKMLSYTGYQQHRVVIEHAEGSSQVIQPSEWAGLELKVHAWVPARQRSIFRTLARSR